jgi:hypothetical protein
MMRELTLAVEAIASEVPLLLKLEDIHWSDASTLDWLTHIARHSEPARLDDPIARNMVAVMGGARGEELQAISGLGEVAYASKRTKIRRRVEMF